MFRLLLYVQCTTTSATTPATILLLQVFDDSSIDIDIGEKSKSNRVQLEAIDVTLETKIGIGEVPYLSETKVSNHI